MYLQKNIPYYSGNIKFTKVIGHISIIQLYNAIKKPKKHIINIVDRVKEADKNNDLKLKRQLKHKLYSFTPSIYIDLMQKRKYDNIKKFNNYMQLDFDKIYDAKKLDYIFNELKSNKHIITVFRSPSGKGIKAIANIKKPKNVEHYKAIHKAIKKSFNNDIIEHFDDATKNMVLPMFLTYDFNAIFKNAELFTDEDWSVKNSENINNSVIPNNPKKVIKNKNSTKYNNYKEKTIRIFESKIDNINDNGHPQLRAASLILGSRVSAGYIEYNEALFIMKAAIINNDYFSKDLQNYLRTGEWALKNGLKSPRYYD